MRAIGTVVSSAPRTEQASSSPYQKVFEVTVRLRLRDGPGPLKPGSRRQPPPARPAASPRRSQNAAHSLAGRTRFSETGTANPTLSPAEAPSFFPVFRGKTI